jgi:hypothetical protein
MVIESLGQDAFISCINNEATSRNEVSAEKRRERQQLQEGPRKFAQPAVPQHQGRYHSCRLLLSHLGYLEQSHKYQKRPLLLDPSTRFQRNLANLDSINR